MKVELSELAELDIAGILVYTLEEFGQLQQEKYFELIKEGLQILATFPNVGHMRRDLKFGLLAYPVGEHLLIYEIHEQVSVIVVRVLHSRMDFSGKF